MARERMKLIMTESGDATEFRKRGIVNAGLDKDGCNKCDEMTA